MKLYVSNFTILVLACHLWAGVYFKINVKRYLIRMKTLISTEYKLISGNETDIDCSKHLRKVQFYIATSKANFVEKHETIDVLAKVFVSKFWIELWLLHYWKQQMPLQSIKNCININFSHRCAILFQTHSMYVQDGQIGGGILKELRTFYSLEFLQIVTFWMPILVIFRKIE